MQANSVPLLLPAFLLLLLATAFACAADSAGWPHIRGPHYDGVSGETGLASAWPPSGPPVLWVKELGQGYSSIVTSGQRAYTQYQTLTGQFVLCMDANTGKTIWRYRYDWPFEASGLYPGPYSTPTLWGDSVYFTTAAGSVGCLTLSGSLRWSRDLKKEFDGGGTDFGYACSPTIVEGKVILPVGGRGASVVALDARTGELIWKSGDGAASYVPVLPITVDGHAQVIGYLQHELVGCDLATGKQLWKQPLAHGYNEHSAWPIYREPLLWTSGPFQAGSRLWRLSGGEQAACQLVRHSQWMSNDVSSSVLVGGTLYGFDLAEAQSKAHRPSRGSFRAIDWASGEQLWSNGDSRSRRSTDFETNLAEQSIGHATVLAAEGKLFLLTDLGDLILAEANPERYVELGRARVLGGEIGWASPALSGGRLLVRNRSRAVCLDVGDPAAVSAAAHESGLTVADLPQGEVRDFSHWIGVEPQYAMDPPTRRWLWRWYLAGAAILTAAGLITAAGRLVSAGRISASVCRHLFACLAFVFGIFAGPAASLRLEDFVFTWPVCLFIAFAAAVYRCQLRRGSANAGPVAHARRSGLIAVFALATWGLYFLICRRLSLATQWIFLSAFPAAVPVLLLDRYLIAAAQAKQREGWISLAISWLLMQIAFAAYCALAAGLLALKYELPDR